MGCAESISAFVSSLSCGNGTYFTGKMGCSTSILNRKLHWLKAALHYQRQHAKFSPSRASLVDTCKHGTLSLWFYHQDAKTCNGQDMYTHVHSVCTTHVHIWVLVCVLFIEIHWQISGGIKIHYYKRGDVIDRFVTAFPRWTVRPVHIVSLPNRRTLHVSNHPSNKTFGEDHKVNLNGVWWRGAGFCVWGMRHHRFSSSPRARQWRDDTRPRPYVTVHYLMRASFCFMCKIQCIH